MAFVRRCDAAPGTHAGLMSLRHLRAVLDEYVTHYNKHRLHRARNLQPPERDGDIAPVTDLATALIRRHGVLGGLIHEYERAA